MIHALLWIDFYLNKVFRHFFHFDWKRRMTCVFSFYFFFSFSFFHFRWWRHTLVDEVDQLRQDIWLPFRHSTIKKNCLGFRTQVPAKRKTTQKICFFIRSDNLTIPYPCPAGHSFPLVHWLQNFSVARTTRSTKYWFVKGFADHFSKSHRPPVVRGADFGNHCLSHFLIKVTGTRMKQGFVFLFGEGSISSMFY